MRTSSIIFFGAVLAIFAFDYVFNYLPKVDFEAQGKAHPYVQEVVKDLNSPIDATASPIEERRFSVGYIMRAKVMPGIRLIHDPTMGKEVIAKGPAAALEVLSFEAKEGRLVPDFTKLVRLNDLIEVRVNLEAHGSDHMRIQLHRNPRRNTLNSEFTTAGSLTFQFLELVNSGDKKIEVNTENLVLWSHNYTDHIYGTTDRLEICRSEITDTPVSVPNLVAGETIRTEYDNNTLKILGNILTPFAPKPNKDSVNLTDSLVIVKDTVLQ